MYYVKCRTPYNGKTFSNFEIAIYVPFDSIFVWMFCAKIMGLGIPKAGHPTGLGDKKGKLLKNLLKVSLLLPLPAALDRRPFP
jgi:hypothetical protein